MSDWGWILKAIFARFLTCYWVQTGAPRIPLQTFKHLQILGTASQQSFLQNMFIKISEAAGRRWSMLVKALALFWGILQISLVFDYLTLKV